MDDATRILLLKALNRISDALERGNEIENDRNRMTMERDIFIKETVTDMMQKLMDEAIRASQKQYPSRSE